MNHGSERENASVGVVTEGQGQCLHRTLSVQLVLLRLCGARTGVGISFAFTSCREHRIDLEHRVPRMPARGNRKHSTDSVDCREFGAA